MPADANSEEFEERIKRTTEDAEAADEISRGVGVEPGSFVVVPVPILEPTFGYGGALTGLYTFSASDQPDTPRSTLAAAAGYTSNDSWLVGGGLKLYLDGDRYRVGLSVGYGRLNLKYFGTGDDPILSENPIDFSSEGGFVEASGQVRIVDNTYLGAQIRYLDATVGSKLPIDALPALQVPFELAAIGPTLEYDTRDSTWWPAGGSQGSLELLLYDEGIGSDADFTRSDAQFSHYLGVGEELVLAGQLRAAAASDDTPFFLKPFVNLRGFPAGRYLDSVVVQGQAELRWMAWRRLGVVGFGGMGLAGPDWGSLDDRGPVGAVGAGVRYRVSEVDGMNAGFDVAYGDDSVVAYFRIGEAF